ncbi:MAG: hypothetical protein MN733_06980 [Nitrososphaera sp.]|nr:hypothetical protein [Nitrososphaera sp.]
MDHLVICYPSTHTLRRLNGAAISFLRNVTKGWGVYRILALPIGVTYVGSGVAGDEITLDESHTKMLSHAPKFNAKLYREVAPE